MSLRREKLLTSTALYLAIAAAFTATAQPLAAQVHDPAPGRVAIETYGSRSGSSQHDLSVDVDATGEATNIVVAGSTIDHLGVLILGAKRIAVRGPRDTLLLSTLR